jgi:hypothetical protein
VPLVLLVTGGKVKHEIYTHNMKGLLHQHANPDISILQNFTWFPLISINHSILLTDTNTVPNTVHKSCYSN